MDKWRFLIIDTQDRRDKIKHWIQSIADKPAGCSAPCVFDCHTLDDSSADWADWIVLVHRNDLFSTNGRPGQQDVTVHERITNSVRSVLEKAAVILAYTGGGGLCEATLRQAVCDSDLSCDSNKWFAVSRSVNRESDEKDDFQQLIRWASSADRHKAERPILLHQQQTPQCAVSLSLLCEGYLAAYAGLKTNSAAQQTQAKNCPAVGHALKSMGWIDDEKRPSASKAVDDLQLPPPASLPQTEYWTSALGQADQLQAECRLLPNSGETVNAGSSLPAEITALVEAIQSDKVTPDDFVCRVAKAYLALNKLLGTAA